ncbi:MAG: hypothetical protein CMD68_00015 [Gammaproteobacteria bacterium]|nr:hypothetical protein [Gammaproteobacteria bacterium]
MTLTFNTIFDMATMIQMMEEERRANNTVRSIVLMMGLLLVLQAIIAILSHASDIRKLRKENFYPYGGNVGETIAVGGEVAILFGASFLSSLLSKLLM